LKARITRIEIAMTADEPRRWRFFEWPHVSWGAAPRWNGAGPLALKSEGILLRILDGPVFDLPPFGDAHLLFFCFD
jgi:hypothetical protein